MQAHPLRGDGSLTLKHNGAGERVVHQNSHATSRLQAKVESSLHLSILKTLTPFNYIIVKFSCALYSMFSQVHGERHGAEAKIAFNAIQIRDVIKGEESHSSFG